MKDRYDNQLASCPADHDYSNIRNYLYVTFQEVFDIQRHEILQKTIPIRGIA